MQPPPNPYTYINPGVPQVYLPHNPLDHDYWDRVFNRGYQEYARFLPHTDARIPQDSCLLSRNLAPIVYVCGMVGYAAAVPVRVVCLGGAILRLAWCDGRPLSARFSEVLQAIGGIFASIFGIICPLVGYQMDRWIYRGIENPAAIRIRDGLAREIQDEVARRREAAIQVAMPQVRGDHERLAQTRAQQIQGMQIERQQIEANQQDNMEAITQQVEAADVARRARVDTRIAAIEANANQRVEQAQADFAAEMERRMRSSRQALAELREAAGQKYRNFDPETRRLKRIIRGGARQELAQPGSVQRLSNPPIRIALAAHSEFDRFAALFSHAYGYLEDGDRGMNGPALDLLKETFGKDALIVQETVAGTNREAILAAWLLLSMDQFGHQTPSPLVALLNKVLLGVGDGFGGIYEDYTLILGYLALHQREGDRLGRLLRIAFDQERTDGEFSLQIRRIVAQLIAASEHLLPILQRLE